MLFMLKRKLNANRRNNILLFLAFFVLVTFTSVGYSALSQNLMISGDVDYYVNSNKLYNVLKRAADVGTYAKEYTGSHQDSISGDGDKKIYYWYGSNATNGTAIQNMNNVIFAGQCWQMIRTTDTGGVKMIYNGEPENNQCLNTRGTHVGYASRTSQNLNGNYWYGTSYTYDSSNQTFSIAGILEQKTWNATNGPDLIGKYTCKSTSSDGTCATLYLVESYYSTSNAYVIPLNSSSHYSQFGKLPFNTDSTIAHTGYMYNTVYTANYLAQTESMLSSTSLSINYWYADSVTWGSPTASRYNLDNPYQVSATTDYPSLVGKYTFRNATSTYVNTSVYYIAAVNNTTMYYISLTNSGNHTLSDFNYTYTYGDSYTDNGDGTYTITNGDTNPVTINRTDWYSNYGSINNKYVCKNATNNSCNEVWYITSTTISNFTYVKPENTYKYSKSFTYSNGTYALNDDESVSFWNYTDATNKTSLNNAHYTCFNATGVCSTINYIYYISGTTFYYLELQDGKSIKDALNEMLYNDDVNTNDSIMKKGIDAWYRKYLIDYDSYIEDTIFCQNKTPINTTHGFNPNGGSVSSYMSFSVTTGLNCSAATEKYSVSNPKAHLTYKTALISNPEIKLLGNSNVYATGQYYYIFSSNNMSGTSMNFISIGIGTGTSNGGATSASGVRPAISLVPDIEFISGDGSMANPYVVDAESTQVNPDVPTISGSATRVYGLSTTTLTCSTPTTYENGMNVYYSFGYATTDGGTPSNWTTASTTNTLTISPTEYIGQRWYSCRIYATDGASITNTINSLPAGDAEVTINNATITFNTNINNGTLSGTSPLYVKVGDSNVYTEIRGTTVGTVPTATKEGYTFTGWYTASTNGNKVLNADGTFTGTAIEGYTTTNSWATIENKTLYAQFAINNPEHPRISGGDTKVYNYQDTTLTCTNTTSYATGTSVYYEFGYATSTTNFTNGTITWLGNASTTNTLLIGKTAFRTVRYYTCRVYASDDSNTTETVAGTSYTTMGLVNARLYFNATENGGTTTTQNLYVPYGQSNIYTERTNTTAGTIPTATKVGYTFAGWYTASSGGNQVIDALGVVQASVSSWTNASNQWIRTSTSTSATANVLYAQFSPITYTINYTMNGGVKGASGPTSGTYDTNVEVTKPTKTFTVNIDANSQGASITSGGSIVTSVSGVQTFAGWTGTNINTSTAKYGSSSSTVTTSWSNGTTAVGSSYDTTYFKNLRNTTGTVTLTANWTAVAVTLPKVEKTGYECSFNTSSDGRGTSYASEGTYTPSTTSGSDTLYVRCEIAMLMQNNYTTSQTFGKSISRDSFESITTLNSKTVPNNAIDSWDVSSEQNGSVMAWYLDEDNDSKYELYIGQDGGVKANTDSSYAFDYFQNLDSIDLTYFNTTGVTDMTSMFSTTGSNSTVFTLDLGDKFDTSSVTTMQNMFYYTGRNSTVFTLDLGDKFDTSSVTNMAWMFSYTGSNSTVFTLDLGDKFDTSSVTNMQDMFSSTGYSSTAFTLDLGDKFDTSSVTNMQNMFGITGYSNTSFTLDLGDKFDTSSVTNMAWMFSSTGRNSTVFTLDLGDKFDTSSVTTMQSMFSFTGYSSTVFTLDLGDKFDTSSVTNMQDMFYYTGDANTTFEIDLTRFDFSNVTSYSGIFRGWVKTNTIWVKDASDQSWIITNSGNSNLTVANVLYPFNYTIGYTMNGGVKTSGETSIANGSIITVGKPTKTFTVNIDANSQGASITSGGSTVTSVSEVQTFAGWTGTNINTSTAKYGSSSSTVTTSWSDGTTTVGGSNATTYFKNLIGSPGTVTLTANWTTGNITLPKVEKTGYECSFNTSSDGSGTSYASEGTYTPSTTSGSDTLYVRCEEIAMLMQHNNTTSQTFGKSISRDSFESITTLNSKTVPGTAIDSWDVSSTGNGRVMAWYLDEDNDSKYELYIGQDGGVKANTDSSYAFYYFRNLDSIDLTYFDTSSVENMNSMFYYTGYRSTVFTLDLGDKFDTSSVTNMYYMFSGTGYSSTAFTLDLGNLFDTSSVTTMDDMFSATGYSNTAFTLDLGDKFDTSSVTNMNGMFYRTGYSSTVFTLDLGDKFDTSSVESMSHMFDYTGRNSTVFTLDLGDKFDTSSVTNMFYMFRETGYSSTAFTLDLGDKFDTSSVTTMSNMFNNTGYRSTVFTLDLGDKFDTSSVTTMSYMFNNTGYRSTVFTLDLGDKFDTSSVTTMERMFYRTGYANTTFEIDLTQFDFSNVTSYSNIFNGWRTTNTIWVKDASDQSWVITNSGNSNLTTSNVLIR